MTWGLGGAIKWLLHNVKAVTVVGAVCAVIGWTASQYMDYRTAYKEALNQNYEHFDAASADVLDSLRQFANIARGSSPKRDDDVSQLQMRLVKAVGAADDLQRRLNGSMDVIESYRTAAIALKHASEDVTGPADAKPLVEAASEYLLAEQKLRDRVIKEGNSFL